jgi:hypothetical protein
MTQTAQLNQPCGIIPRMSIGSFMAFRGILEQTSRVHLAADSSQSTTTKEKWNQNKSEFSMGQCRS